MHPGDVPARRDPHPGPDERRHGVVRPQHPPGAERVLHEPDRHRGSPMPRATAILPGVVAVPKPTPGATARPTRSPRTTPALRNSSTTCAPGSPTNPPRAASQGRTCSTILATTQVAVSTAGGESPRRLSARFSVALVEQIQAGSCIIAEPGQAYPHRSTYRPTRNGRGDALYYQSLGGRAEDRAGRSEMNGDGGRERTFRGFPCLRGTSINPPCTGLSPRLRRRHCASPGAANSSSPISLTLWAGV